MLSDDRNSIWLSHSGYRRRSIQPWHVRWSWVTLEGFTSYMYLTDYRSVQNIITIRYYVVLNWQLLVTKRQCVPQIWNLGDSKKNFRRNAPTYSPRTTGSSLRLWFHRHILIHGWDIITSGLQKTTVRHIGIIFPVSISTISACHFALICQILSTSDHLPQKNDVMSIFKMADLRHLGFYGSNNWFFEKPM